MTAEQIVQLRKFVAWVLSEREEESGIDAFDLEDALLEHGILRPVMVHGPCGEFCRCAEAEDFPQDCLQYTDLGRACLVDPTPEHPASSGEHTPT